ncbi:solute carrier organic anion transporter family member 4A1-like [Physella acuta]|uniref:solute carrier organic anion transporter family member 4A1-like n=1 Tax=Physella acuta TaxID=109671 RepID=UPI0027DDCE35|nr:solute carrier organic anion transporter family member 4A1-like [Physella acuta]
MANVSTQSWPRFVHIADQLSTSSLGRESRSCYEDCHCQNDNYLAVCGDNDLTYYSPCTAGCTSQREGTFRNCSCTPSGNANSGTCKYGCGQLYLYIFFLGVRVFFLSLTIVPTLVVNIWCSRKENKDLAAELYSLLFAVAGSIGPIAFGHMIDETCLIWDHHCGVKGRCLLYDHKQFQLWFHAYTSVPMAMSLVFLVMAYTLCRWNSDTEYKQYRKNPTVIATINIAIVKYENDNLGTPV